MSYRVDLGVVTDEKGIKTILESEAGKQLQDVYGIDVYQLDPGNRYHFMLEDVSYGGLVDIGLFKILESLEYRETLLIGEEIDAVEHDYVWPESMPNELKIPYLTLKRECTLSCFARYNNPNIAVKKFASKIGMEATELSAFINTHYAYDDGEKH